MDLFLCTSCGRRFIVPTGDASVGRRCRACGHGLELKVRSIPGRGDLVARALDAELLDPSSADGGRSPVPEQTEAER